MFTFNQLMVNSFEVEKMTSNPSERGASGHGSIVFRQNLEYPREPEKITYYPPEPSEELKKQVARDKAGGIGLYFIGFAIALIAFGVALGYSNQMELYATLIPFLLIFGLVFAILFLIMKNVTLAKLSRTMPLILLVALLLLYIFSILTSVMDLTGMENENDISNGFENLISSIINPAFFLLTAGLIIARAGGTMLWTSTRIVHEYIPATIILEIPGHSPPLEPGEQDIIDEAPFCEDCNKPMSYIAQYERWYCYDCKEYLSREDS